MTDGLRKYFSSLLGYQLQEIKGEARTYGEGRFREELKCLNEARVFVGLPEVDIESEVKKLFYTCHYCGGSKRSINHKKDD